MAKKQKQHPGKIEVPAGFTKRVAAERWYWPKEDSAGEINPLRGVLLGRMQRQDDASQYYYVVELSANCVGVKKGEDGQQVYESLEPGDLIFVNESYNLSPLRQLYAAAQSQGRACEVMIVPRGKQAVGGGRSVWKFDIFDRPIKRVLNELAPPEQIKALPTEGSESDEDIPF